MRKIDIYELAAFMRLLVPKAALRNAPDPVTYLKHSTNKGSQAYNLLSSVLSNEIAMRTLISLLSMTDSEFRDKANHFPTNTGS